MKKSIKVVSTELMPVSSRKSFGRKAYVLDDLHGTHYLKSYSTVMCSVDANSVVRRHSDARSMTTSSHLKSFLAVFAPGTDNAKFYALPLENRPELVESI